MVVVGADLVSAQKVAVCRIVAEQGKGRHKVCPYNATAGHWGARAIENGELRAFTTTRAQTFQGEHVRRSDNLQIPLSEANFTEINHLIKPNGDAPAHHVITTDGTTAVRQ